MTGLSRVARWGPVVAYMAAIFIASSISHPPALPIGGSDKVVHGGMYAGLSVLLVRAMAGGLRRPVTRKVAIFAVVWSVVYGGSDEIHQHFVPPRQMDALDLVADGVGATLAAGAMYTGIIRGRNGV